MKIIDGDKDRRVAVERRAGLHEFDCRNYTSEYLLEKVNRDLVLRRDDGGSAFAFEAESDNQDAVNDGGKKLFVNDMAKVSETQQFRKDANKSWLNAIDMFGTETNDDEVEQQEMSLERTPGFQFTDLLTGPGERGKSLCEVVTVAPGRKYYQLRDTPLEEPLRPILTHLTPIVNSYFERHR